MVVTVPVRAAAQPRRIASFPCWQFVIFQVIGAAIVYLAENPDELKTMSDNPGQSLNDGLQINQASGIVMAWWKGDLWAAASVANTQFVMMAPGSQSSTSPNASAGLPPGGGGVI